MNNQFKLELCDKLDKLAFLKLASALPNEGAGGDWYQRHTIRTATVPPQPCRELLITVPYGQSHVGARQDFTGGSPILLGSLGTSFGRHGNTTFRSRCNTGLRDRFFFINFAQSTLSACIGIALRLIPFRPTRPPVCPMPE